MKLCESCNDIEIPKWMLDLKDSKVRVCCQPCERSKGKKHSKMCKEYFTQTKK